MSRVSIWICVAFILTLTLTGCPAEKEVINHLQFSDQAPQAVVGGWARVPLAASMEDNAGTYRWEQDTSNGTTAFLTKLYVVDDILGHMYSDSPDLCYIIVTPEKEGNAEVAEQVSNQILDDLQLYNWDLTGDARIDDKDLKVITGATDRPKGEAENQALALLRMIPADKDLAVHSSKRITTWGGLKK